MDPVAGNTPSPSATLFGALARQFDRHVRRGTEHPRASVRVVLAPDQRFQQQKELFGEHGAVPLAMACLISSLDLSGLNRLHSITSARAPAAALPATGRGSLFPPAAAPAEGYPRSRGRCGVEHSPELKSLIRGPRITGTSRRGHWSRRNLAARRRIGLSIWCSRSSQAASSAWRR